MGVNAGLMNMKSVFQASAPPTFHVKYRLKESDDTLTKPGPPWQAAMISAFCDGCNYSVTLKEIAVCSEASVKPAPVPPLTGAHRKWLHSR